MRVSFNDQKLALFVINTTHILDIIHFSLKQ